CREPAQALVAHSTLPVAATPRLVEDAHPAQDHENEARARGADEYRPERAAVDLRERQALGVHAGAGAQRCAAGARVGCPRRAPGWRRCDPRPCRPSAKTLPYSSVRNTTYSVPERMMAAGRVSTQAISRLRTVDHC